MSTSDKGEVVDNKPDVEMQEKRAVKNSAQVVPLVYIQTPTKLPTNNLITVPHQLKFATLPQNNKSIMLTTSVKKAPQKLLIHKPGVPMVPVSSATYLTMIKPLGETKSEAPNKYVIAPMPKMLKNRLPVTMTTNTNIKSKLSFMPFGMEDKNKIKDDVPNLRCDEIIDLDSPVKSEKEYELSIVEDSNSNNCNSVQCKEFPKYAKHGISILKKNYQPQNTLGEKTKSQQTVNNVTNSVTDGEQVKPQKSERRRKSNFSYRKEFDSMEEATDINRNNEDCDLQKMLKWDAEGIGSLPGSDLKFIINEFNMLEYVTSEEYDKIIKSRKVKNGTKNDLLQSELRCVECGCYGLPSEFITPKYCSLDCQDSHIPKDGQRDKETKVKKKRRKTLAWKKCDSEPIILKASPNSSEEENTSNENSQDRFSYPWTCSKKGFSWSKYLDHIKAKAAPTKLFKDPFPYNRNCFKPGMKMEGIDPNHPSYFCVLTVAEACGYRLRLHFDGYPDSYDFWANADSMDIFPAGWCEKHDHALHPPPGYKSDNFNWLYYLKVTKSTAAPKHLFANRASNTICPNGFRIGMKLEAVDRKNNSLVCVATVKDMMDNRILVHFDSWDHIYDYWADPTSPYIHPVGWCDQFGHNLTPPNDYPNPETFSWDKFLKETKSVAAPVRAFKQRPACGFKREMRLECVDKRVPQFIRVASVADVRGHQIRICFDGWPDRYGYWLDDDNEDIHPVGWCHKTGHPIESPLTPDDVYDFLECPTIGCKGLGHLHGAKYASHSEQKFCPYAEENIDREKVLPDRLLSPDFHIEAVVPVSREPKDKIKPRLGRPPKNIKSESFENTDPPKRKYRKRLKVEEDANMKFSTAVDLIEQSRLEPAVKESWKKHSLFLNGYLKDVGDPLRWGQEKLAKFLTTIPECDKHVDTFRSLEMDGEAFLSLNQRDLIRLLKIKVGPAIKLYNIIILLRQKSASIV